jgi:SH3-like domain-containing protein
VEDYEGRDGWVNKSLLKTKCKSIVIKNTELYRIIKGKKTAIFILQKGNLVVVKKCNKKFCQVMFDKKFGFVKKENLWGIV